MVFDFGVFCWEVVVVCFCEGLFVVFVLLLVVFDEFFVCVFGKVDKVVLLWLLFGVLLVGELFDDFGLILV